MQEQLKIQAVGQKQVLPLTSLSPTTLQVQWAKNSTYQIDFTAYDNGGADFAMLSAEASIYFGDDEFIIKSLQPSYQNGVSAKQVTATHVMSETSRIFVRDVKQGTITYLPKDVIDMFFKNNEYGFTYEIHGDFEKQQIENLGNCNGQDALSKIISTWEDAIIFPIGRKIHIYNEKAWVKNYQKRIDYIKDTNDVQLTVDSTGLANIVKVYGKQKDTDDSNKVEYYFDPFIVQDTASITSWGKHPMDDISDERFTDAKSMEKYARTQFVLEPIVSIQVTTNDNQKPTPGEQRYLIVHNNDFETFVTLEQYTWTPFNPNQGTQLIFDNMPVSILRTNANIAKRLSLASKQAKEAMDKAKNASNVFYSDTEPSSHKLGDTWYKKVSTDGNGQPLYSIKVWNGTTWVEVVNTEQWNKDWKAWNKHIEDEIIKAQNDFNSAWDKANNADNTATQALTSANAKTTNYYSGANGMAPVNPKNNDTWFKTEKDGHVSINVYDATTGKWINNDDYINRAHDEVKKLTETVPTKEQLSNSFEQATSEFSSQFNSIRLSTSEQNSQTYIETSQAIEDKANQINDVITANEAYNKSERDKLQASVRAEMSELSNADIALGSELDKASSEINSVRSETSANINHVKQSVSGAYNKISSLSDSLSLATSEIDSNYQSNSTSLSNLAKGLDSLSTGVKRTTDSLTATYNDQKGKVATLTTDVNGLKGAVKDNEDNINSLSLGAKGMSASISNAQGSINTLQADANGLKQEVTKKVDNTTYQTGISNLNNQIDLKANKSYVDGELSKKANSAELSVTNEQVKAQASRISSVTTTVNGVSSVANNALSKANNAQGTADSAVSKADNANSKIDNLSIGGRNLLKGTADFSFNFGYNDVDSSQTGISDNGEGNKQVKFYKYNASNTGIYFSKSLTVGQEYTLSFDARVYSTATGDETYIRYGYENLKTNTDYLSTDWKRYSVTFTVDTTRAFIIYSNTKHTVYIRKIQLEKGNKATDWSPAPEDVEGKITDLQNKTTPQQLIKTVTDTSQANHVITADSVNQSITGVRTEITKAKDELTGKLTTVETKVQQNTNETKSTKDKTERLISSLGADSNGNFTWANNSKIDTALGSYQTIKKIDGKIENLSSPNLVYNSDFTNNAEGWTSSTKSVDNSFYGTYGGKPSLRISTLKNDTVSWWGASSKQIPIKDGNTKVSAGVRMRIIGSKDEFYNDGQVVLSIDFGNDTDARYKHSGVTKKSIDVWDWTYVSLENVDIPTDAKFVRLQILRQGYGNVVFVQPMMVFSAQVPVYQPDTMYNADKIAQNANNLTSYKAEVSNTYAKASSVYTKADVDGIAKSVKEQSADSIKSEISKVTIGGRNLLKNSDFRNDNQTEFHKTWFNGSDINWDYSSETPFTSNERSLFITYKSTGNSTATGISYQTPIVLASPQEYTIGFWAKASVNGLKVQVESNGKRANFTLTTSWQYYSDVITFQSANRTLYMHNGGAVTGSWYLFHPQLEKGNKATDWSPAPEDVAYKSQVLQKNDSWVANIISNGGNLVSSINANTDGVRLQGKRITLDGSSYIANGVINNAMIANLDASKINAGSIDGQRLRGTVIDGNVANIKNLHATNLFADGLIDGKFLHITGASQLDNSIITNAKIADGAITTAKIGNGQISNALIANGAINSAKIANATIGTAQIADGAITNAKIGTIDAGKITTGTLNAGLIKTGSMSADRIVGGTLDMSKITAKNINASSITTGILGGANLSLNLMTGAVDFRHGHIQSTSGNFHIDIDNGTIEAFNGIGNGVGIHNGVFELTGRTLFDNNQKPYFKIDNYITSTTGAGSYHGASLQGRDALEIYVGDTEPSDLLTSSGYGILIDKTFGTRVIGGNTGVTLTAGTAYGDVVKSSPQIAIGAGNRGLTGGSEIHINASYTRITSATNRTTSSSPNLYVADDGTLLRSTSASKYKTAIVDAHGMENYGEKLINISPKLWVDKAEKARFKEGRNDGYVLHYGLIADELDKEGLSKLVRYDGDGEIEGIEYDKIAVALLPLLKKQQNQIAELQEQITELKGR